MRIRVLTVGTAVALIGSLVATSVAGATSPPRPTVSSFSVTVIDSAYQQQSSTPLTLYRSGGDVLLQAAVSSATACNFSSNRPVPGLPYDVPCSSSVTTPTLHVPANTGKKQVRYQFKLQVIGHGSTHGTPIVVIVGTSPNPNLAAEVPAGSAWVLGLTGCSQSPQTAALEFKADGSFSGSFDGGGNPLNGTYALSTYTLSMSDPTDGFSWSLYWQPSPRSFVGGGPYGCTWTLSPSAATIFPGSYWTLSSACSTSVSIVFFAGGTYSSDGQPPATGASYTENGLQLVIVAPNGDGPPHTGFFSISFSWSSGSGQYVGTDDLLDCSWTLVHNSG